MCSFDQFIPRCSYLLNFRLKIDTISCRENIKIHQRAHKRVSADILISWNSCRFSSIKTRILPNLNKTVETFKILPAVVKLKEQTCRDGSKVDRLTITLANATSGQPNQLIQQTLNSRCNFTCVRSMACSRIIFIGTAGVLRAPMTSTGRQDLRSYAFEILPASASAKELSCCSSVSTRHLPCNATDLKIAFVERKQCFDPSLLPVREFPCLLAQ
jgi:hypothetical protein